VPVHGARREAQERGDLGVRQPADHQGDAIARRDATCDDTRDAAAGDLDGPGMTCRSNITAKDNGPAPPSGVSEVASVATGTRY
jgi:hypothetical protein